MFEIIAIMLSIVATTYFAIVHPLGGAYVGGG